MVDKAGKNQPMVDKQGRFFRLEDLDPAFVEQNVDVEKYKEYAGRYVKNAYDPEIACDAETTLDIDLAVMLKAQNKAFKIEKHTHSYPHCWRTDKPVLYYPLDSWFIRTTALRERMIDVFREQYGHDPKVEAIHAGVECGLFAGKLPGLDCVSFGPDLTEIHTCRERMHIASVQRVWRYTLEVLRRCK